MQESHIKVWETRRQLLMLIYSLFEATQSDEFGISYCFLLIFPLKMSRHRGEGKAGTEKGVETKNVNPTHIHKTILA